MWLYRRKVGLVAKDWVLLQGALARIEAGALVRLLIDKGVITREEFQAAMAAEIESLSEEEKEHAEPEFWQVVNQVKNDRY